MKVNEEPIPDGLSQFIAVCRNTGFQFKDFIGVLIDFVFGRRSKPYDVGIKIGKDIFIFFINASMSLINDDEIEVPTGEQFSTIFVLSFVNAVHHGLIGGKDAPCRTV